ncbi:MAG: diguanylate cyclase [Oscillochloridaceae bacterium umkhey_bin13]
MVPSTLNAEARALREHNPQQALALAETAQRQAEQGGDQFNLVTALVQQAHCHVWLSHFSLALGQGLTALTQAEHLTDYDGWADLYLALGRAQLNLANLAEARDWLQRAQHSAVAHDQYNLAADALNVLGVTAFRLTEYDQALEAYAQAEAIYIAQDNHYSRCKVLINRAEAYSKQGRASEALASAEAAHTYAQTVQSRFWQAYTLHTLGQVYADQAHYAEAIAPLEASLPVAQEVGSPYIGMVSRIALGQIYQRSNQVAAALAAFEDSLQQAEALDHTLYRYRCHEALANLYETTGDWQMALSHYKQFHRLKEQVFNEQNMARLQNLEVVNQLAQMRQAAQNYQQRNSALEAEIARRTALEQELQHQASTDALTGLANRRAFLHQAELVLGQAQAQHRRLSLAVIDLDHFKQINDFCGHAIGDRALQMVSAVFQSQIRTGDVLARFGGDEFVLLLPDTDQAQAVRVFERVRQQLRANPLTANETSLLLTLSVGVTSLTHTNETLDYLLARADAGLYKAKRAGRNQVMVAD